MIESEFMKWARENRRQQPRWRLVLSAGLIIAANRLLALSTAALNTARRLDREPWGPDDVRR